MPMAKAKRPTVSLSLRRPFRISSWSRCMSYSLPSGRFATSAAPSSLISFLSPSASAWHLLARGDIRKAVWACGEVRVKTQVSVGTSVLGEIKHLLVSDGQDVKAGDVLVIIDQERLKQSLVQGSAALVAARRELE